MRRNKRFLEESKEIFKTFKINFEITLDVNMNNIQIVINTFKPETNIWSFTLLTNIYPKEKEHKCLCPPVLYT